MLISGTCELSFWADGFDLVGEPAKDYTERTNIQEWKIIN